MTAVERRRGPMMSRRTFLALSAAVVVGCTDDGGDDSSGDGTGPAPEPDATQPTTPATSAPPTAPESTAGTLAPTTTVLEPQPALSADPFLLGVASGDPDDRSVVLWTRLVGDGLPDGDVEVVWELVDETGDVVRAGLATARADHAHAVHVVVDVDGPARFRFRAGGGWESSIGTTQPATPRDEFRLATASCQHFETGYYAAHRDLAEWGPDLVLFLGDFIYEGAGRPVADGRVRSHEGDEARTLDGYRARYAQYLSDPQLQRARATCPWIVVWDDHEVENNYAGLVPEDPAEAASFAQRRAEAYRAWWEHTPTRLPPPEVDDAAFEIHRGVEYGTLARISVLDGRQHRSDQACGSPVLSTDPPCAEALDPARTMLGPEQEAWLADRFATTTATWNVVGQQTVMTDLRLPNGAILNFDQWDGYAPARDRLLASAPAGLVVLTGDIHLAGVGLLGDRGVEFVTTSISSAANLDPALQPLLAGFDTVVDAELEHRGYTRHVVTAASWVAEYRQVTDVTDPDSEVTTWRSFRTTPGSATVAVADD